MNKKVIGKAIECLACIGLFAVTWRINSNTKLEDELDKVKTELKVSQDALTNANSKLEETKGKLDNAEENLNNIESELNNVTGSLNDALKELDSIKEELEIAKNKVSREAVYDAFFKAKNDILYGTGGARENLRISVENKLLNDEYYIENWISIYTFENGKTTLIEDYSDETYDYAMVHEEIESYSNEYLKACLFDGEDESCEFHKDVTVGYTLNFMEFYSYINSDNIFNLGITEEGNYYFYAFVVEEIYDSQNANLEQFHTLTYCEVTQDGKFVEYSRRAVEYESLFSDEIKHEEEFENFTLKFYYGGVDADYINRWIERTSLYEPK